MEHDRRHDDPWKQQTDCKLKNLDEGQLHIINRLASQDEMLTKLLDETAELRKLAKGARWGAWFISSGMRCLHVVAKWIAPILAAIITAWAIVWAYFNGGKPPNIP